tara:strand:+ start:22625 stop:23398 length:774 start_codon:yes stop_codon:yes gene_type:complete
VKLVLTLTASLKSVALVIIALLNSGCVTIAMNGIGTVIGGPIAYTEQKMQKAGVLDCETGSPEDRATLGGNILVVLTYTGLAIDTVAGLIVPPVSCLYLNFVSDIGAGWGNDVVRNAEERANSWSIKGNDCVDQELLKEYERQWEDEQREKREQRGSQRPQSGSGTLNLPELKGPKYDPERPRKSAEYRFSAREREMPVNQYASQRNFYCTEWFAPRARRLFLREIPVEQRGTIKTSEKCVLDRNNKECICTVRTQQ